MTDFWEQWVGSTTAPARHIKRGAKIHTRDGRRWITYTDDINGAKVVVDTPDNAPTKSCDQGRHDDCPHRLGGPQEGGVILKLSLAAGSFTWRCGCPCHNDPWRAGRLF